MLEIRRRESPDLQQRRWPDLALQGIGSLLPEDERAYFLSQYREAVDGARDPAGWQQLRRVLRLWRYHAAARDYG